MNASRTRLALLGFLLLLALDGARSWNLRAAASRATAWAPGYDAAQPIPWPPAPTAGSGLASGRGTYLQHCAICHGEAGRGNGPVAAGLRPRPRDLTSGIFKFKSTPGRMPPTRDDVRRSIAKGLHGTSMPAFEDILSAQALDAVATYVLSLGPHPEWGSAEPLPPAIRAALESADPQNGQSGYASLGCGSCHGTSGEGDGSAAPHLKDVWKQPDPPRNLRAPWTFRRGNDVEEIYLRIAYGISGSPMPAYNDVASPAEIASVVAFIRSIAATPPWEDGGKLSAPPEEPSVERGRYLFEVGVCGNCHTPADNAGIYRRATHLLAGGVRVDVRGHGVFVSANLTPDVETGLGSWDRSALAAALLAGSSEGRLLHPWAEPRLSSLAATPVDAASMAAYLESIPAVRNAIPALPSPGVLETVLQHLLQSQGTPAALRFTIYSQNRGTPEASSSALRVAHLMQAFQGIVLIAAFALLLYGSSTLQRPGGLLLSALLVAAMGGLGLWWVARTPSAPTKATAIGAEEKLPALHAEALLARGKHVYTAGGCVFCHGADGRGGARLDWFVHGTSHAANRTPLVAGLQNWRDDDVLRFLSSGVRPDGRSVHWRGSAWDRSANLSDEDRHAVVAYLRNLTPIAGAAARP